MNEELRAKQLSESIDRLLQIGDCPKCAADLPDTSDLSNTGELADPELLQFAQRLAAFNLQPDQRVRRRLRLRLFEALQPTTAFGWNWRWVAYCFQWRSPLAPAMLALTLLFLSMGWPGSPLYDHQSYPTFQTLQNAWMAPTGSGGVAPSADGEGTNNALTSIPPWNPITNPVTNPVTNQTTSMTFASKETQSTPPIPIATPALGTPRPIPVPVPEQLESFQRDL